MSDSKTPWGGAYSRPSFHENGPSEREKVGLQHPYLRRGAPPLYRGRAVHVTRRCWIGGCKGHAALG